MNKASKLAREHQACAGIRMSGYWKGSPCGAVGLYRYEDKYYCANHYPPTLKTRKNAQE